jgi:hypothetical protein
MNVFISQSSFSLQHLYHSVLHNLSDVGVDTLGTTKIWQKKQNTGKINLQ